jgi:hypothetical protein
MPQTARVPGPWHYLAQRSHVPNARRPPGENRKAVFVGRVRMILLHQHHPAAEVRIAQLEPVEVDSTRERLRIEHHPMTSG